MTKRRMKKMRNVRDDSRILMDESPSCIDTYNERRERMNELELILIIRFEEQLEKETRMKSVFLVTFRLLKFLPLDGEIIRLESLKYY
jgi:hypothetical protein